MGIPPRPIEAGVSCPNFDENEIKVYNNIDQCINNVKNENWYLTGAEDFYEKAEMLMENGGGWRADENPNITQQELAKELEFDSTYHETTLGVLRTD